MIGREKALELVHEYLGRRRRLELKVSEGWPEGAYRPWGKQPRAVWSVFVVSDVKGVGASHCIVIDAVVGEIIWDGWCGE